MQLDFSSLTSAQRYQAMTQAVIPRPIAWVLTENAQGSYNIAPFSYFTPICSEPPLVLISAGKKASGPEQGAPKDTRRNITQRKDFVIHIPSFNLIDEVHQSAQMLVYGESEIEQLGLELTAFADSPLPRLKVCAVAMHCTLHRIDEIGATPQAVIYGEIQQLYLDDKILNDHQEIDALKYDPVAKLGKLDYSALGKINQPT